jgi:hypothetical protein
LTTCTDEGGNQLESSRVEKNAESGFEAVLQPRVQTAWFWKIELVRIRPDSSSITDGADHPATCALLVIPVLVGLEVVSPYLLPLGSELCKLLPQKSRESTLSLYYR